MTKTHAIDRSVMLAIFFAVVLAMTLGFMSFGHAARGNPRADVQQMVVDEAVRAGLPASLALAVAKVESNFNPKALSSAGARGVMQIMPKTGKDLYNAQADDLWDAQLNIRLGIDYLKSLIKRYEGRWDFALSHYNGGSRVGKPPHSKVIPATRKYVDAVLAWQRRFERKATVIAMADTAQRNKVVADRRSASAQRFSDATPEYWMFDDPTATKDWRHYLKVADYWLGKKQAEAEQPVETQTETSADYTAPPVSNDYVASPQARPSDSLKRRITARRLQFRDRLNWRQNHRAERRAERGVRRFWTGG
ncbi:MAG: lytic transglycosylase domain-containing protein [Rhodospirillales bacterium]|nr:lytic transglycosylase domain-containing protein [Rhodospirillales bacterium]